MQVRSGSNMWTFCLGLCAAVLLGGAPAAAQEFSRGQGLYENHCQSCHESWVHTRDARKVATLNELRRYVASWNVHAGLGWGDEEIGDVADYLARTFYKLEDTP
ncbi:MAG: cytochrome c [Gammaproteobacteria bacterium]|nr:cytochrome c [Gammaproteobacteria bacterium]